MKKALAALAAAALLLLAYLAFGPEVTHLDPLPEYPPIPAR